MKANVCIDVANFQVRAFLTRDFLPTNEIDRVIFIELGGDFPNLGVNIFSILSDKEKNRLYRLASPIGTSGIRGTVMVQVKKEKLVDFLKNKKGG